MSRTKSIIAFVSIVVLAFSVYRIYSWTQLSYQIRSAKAQMLLGKHEQAIDSLAKALRASPSDPELHYLLAIAYRREGKSDSFRVHLEQAEKCGYDNQLDLDRQKILYTIQVGDVHLVQNELNEMLAEDLDDEFADQVYEAISRGHMSSYEMMRALSSLSNWIDWRPDAVLARVWRADIFARRGDRNSAISDLKIALEHDPENRQANLKLGEMYLESNAVEPALTQFEKCFELYPEDPIALTGYARACFRNGLVDRAEELATKNLDVTGFDEAKVDSQMLLAKIYINRGEPKKAIEVLEDARLLQPNNSNLHQALGQAYMYEDKDKAKLHLDRVREIKELDARLVDLSNQLLETPDDTNKRFELAQLLMSKGAKEEAVGWALTILKYEPNHLPARSMLAQYYNETGHSEEAREIFENAAKNVAGSVSSTGTAESNQDKKE